MTRPKFVVSQLVYFNDKDSCFCGEICEIYKIEKMKNSTIRIHAHLLGHMIRVTFSEHFGVAVPADYYLSWDKRLFKPEGVC